MWTNKKFTQQILVQASKHVILTESEYTLRIVCDETCRLGEDLMFECTSCTEEKQHGYSQVHGIQEEETETFHLHAVTLTVFFSFDFLPRPWLL
jgi:hypothetical protein